MQWEQGPSRHTHPVEAAQNDLATGNNDANDQHACQEDEESLWEKPKSFEVLRTGARCAASLGEAAQGHRTQTQREVKLS